jgi:hypothetical protein
MELVQAQSHDDLLAARQLFIEYADWLGVDLCFQGFQQELDGLPGDYAPPDGQLLLAVEDDQAVGCVAMRKLGVLLTNDFVGAARLMQRLAHTLHVPYLFFADATGWKAEAIRAKDRPPLRIGGSQS